MKKLMFILAATAMAVSVHAASVTWSTVAMYNAEGSKVKATATMYVYLMDQTTYGDDVKAGGTTAANAGGSKSASLTSKASVSAPKDTAVANTTYYAAIIATYGTGDDMKYYAEKASVITGDDGNGAFSIGLGKLDSAAVAASNWQSASVPEPTSGILLLVGMAGLALRRKRA